MLCPACGTENASIARFCMACGESLSRACPACGEANPKAAAFCVSCGEAMDGPAAQAARPRTPRGPSRRNRATAGPVSPVVRVSDRKISTTLFADMVSSTQLIHRIDPEDAAATLSPALTAMIAAAEAYDGTVVPQGDGILAVFGAPKAKEDHALQACMAALSIMESVATLGQASIELRIGLHSGEIAVGTITHEGGSELNLSGEVVHLARRLEEQAEPGSIVISADTFNLVRDQFFAEPLGPLALKGQSDPIEAYRIVGRRSQMSRYEARARHTLSPFVGRTAELAVLQDVWSRVIAGTGQLLTVDGDAGVGKSRLIHQLIRSEWTAPGILLEAAATSVDRNSALRPVISMLRTSLGIDSNKDIQSARNTIEPLIAGDAQTKTDLSDAILGLLDFELPESSWSLLDPAKRRDRTLEAISALVSGFAGRQPVILAFEDIHWADSGSLEVINRLADLVGDQSILLILTFRPPFAHDWTQRPYFNHIRVHRLERTAAEAMLDHMLGSGPELDDLKQHIIEHSECTPLFLEELVQALDTSGTLQGEPGQRRLGRPFDEVTIPTTVQPVIAERIDLLDQQQKELLQMAAVAGRESPKDVLLNLSGYSEEEFQGVAASLAKSDLLFERESAPQGGYVFKHALIHQVTYQSLPRDRRRRLHARLLRSLQKLRPDRTQENVQLMAFHADRGQMWIDAARYSCAAGNGAVEKSAFGDAIEFYQNALKCASRTPRSTESLRLSMDARLGLRVALFATENFSRIFELTHETEALAKELEDTPTLLRTATDKSIIVTVRGKVSDAVAYGEQALAQAKQAEDANAIANARYALAQAHWFSGRFRESIEVIEEDLESLRDLKTRVGTGTTGSISVLSFGTLANALNCLGGFERANAAAMTALGLAEDIDRHYDLAFAKCSMGMILHKSGDLHSAIQWLESSLAACNDGRIDVLKPWISAPLARAYADAGRFTEARMLLNEAYQIIQRMDMAAFRAWCLLPTVILDQRQGAIEDGRLHVQELLDLSRKNTYRSFEAEALWLEGLLLQSDDPVAAHASMDRAINAAMELGMKAELERWESNLPNRLVC